MDFTEIWYCCSLRGANGQEQKNSRSGTEELRPRTEELTVRNIRAQVRNRRTHGQERKS